MAEIYERSRQCEQDCECEPLQDLEALALMVFAPRLDHRVSPHNRVGAQRAQWRHHRAMDNRWSALSVKMPSY
jgi:hypothetical protein